MSYEIQTKNNLLLYPGIFPNRLRVDDHYFATIGNGYEWRDGELKDVCKNENNSLEITKIDAIRKSIEFNFDYLSHWNLFSEKIHKTC